MSQHLVSVPESLAHLPEITHPHAEYKLADAVELVVGHCRLFGRQEPSSLAEVRVELERLHAEVSHTWLTVNAALDVVEAAIDGKDLSASNRICPNPPQVTVQPLEVVDAADVARIAKLVEPALRGQMSYDELREELDLPDLTDDEIDERLGLPCAPDLVEVSAYGFACYVFTRQRQDRASAPRPS